MMFEVFVCLAFGAVVPVTAHLPSYKAAENLKASTSKSRSLIDEGTGCWQVAGELFSDYHSDGSLECSDMDDLVKSFVSLGLTNCHMKDRIKRGSDASEEQLCFLFEDEGKLLVKNHINQIRIRKERKNGKSQNDVLSNESMEDSVTRLNEITGNCKRFLTDTAFLVFVEFFNHVDNICFFLQSSIWQEKTERLIDNLSVSSQHVIDQLDMASSQHDLLLAKQEIAIERQQFLLEDSEKLHSVIEDGQSALRSSFGDMRYEVQEESKKLNAVFTEIFSLFNRVLDFQRRFSGQLYEFGSVFLYLVLIISTHHFTATKACKKSRVPVYMVWIAMLLGELSLQRTFMWLDSQIAASSYWAEMIGPMFAVGGLKTLVWRWRMVCVMLSFFIWFRTWWFYKDPFEVYTQTLKDGLETMQMKINSTIRRELHAALNTPQSSQVFYHASDYPQKNPPSFYNMSSMSPSRDPRRWASPHEVIDLLESPEESPLSRCLPADPTRNRSTNSSRTESSGFSVATSSTETSIVLSEPSKKSTGERPVRKRTPKPSNNRRGGSVTPGRTPVPAKPGNNRKSPRLRNRESSITG